MSTQTINVLLIEDSPTDADLIMWSLQEVADVAHFSVDWVDHLGGGLEKISQKKFDVVLSDLSLPDADGLNTFTRINAHSPDLPIVVLTGLDDATVAVEAVKAGAQDYLVKGDINGKVLARAICYAIERKKAEEAIKHLSEQLQEANGKLARLASIDPLTELLNRRGLEDVLARETNRASRGGMPPVAILLDCDDFKHVNDSFGHAVGDLVLKEVARCLRVSVRPTDHVSRIGGDEFLVVLPDTRLAEGTEIAQRVRMAIADTCLAVPSGTITVTASLGLAQLPYNVSSIEEILGLTRAAIKHSKKFGKNQVSAEAPGLGQSLQDSSAPSVEHMLLSVEYFKSIVQPIFHLSHKEEIACEMLGRTTIPSLEMPEDFFRASMEHKILTAVDLLCLKTGLATAKDLREGTKVHVNLFPSTIVDTPTDRLLSLFADTEHTYCVEISEQQFIGDPGNLRPHIAELREAGLLIALDDVGFGRSSLESLIILEPDIVKIAPRYIRGVSSDPETRRVLVRLVGIVKAIGAEMIAEGIESEEDLAVLQDLGIKYGQGFLWGQPHEVTKTMQAREGSLLQ